MFHILLSNFWVNSILVTVWSNLPSINLHNTNIRLQKYHRKVLIQTSHSWPSIAIIYGNHNTNEAETCCKQDRLKLMENHPGDWFLSPHKLLIYHQRSLVEKLIRQPLGLIRDVTYGLCYWPSIYPLPSYGSWSFRMPCLAWVFWSIAWHLSSQDMDTLVAICVFLDI